MIAMKRNCLERDELELVLSGRLEPDEFDAAISHLDDCDRCRSAAESFQQEGEWMIHTLSGSPDPLQAETACQIALWQVLESPDFIVNQQTDAEAIPQEMLGPYRLIRALGSGGMATVFLAEHVRLKRNCAIKILPRERVDQPGWLDRFEREMTTVASLEHANVVRATDAGHQNGLHYLVMEHVDGLDVGCIVSRVGRLDVADACEIVRQAALGLAHIHALGLVHRDVKPSNMMLTRDGGVKLLDLGLVLSGDDPLSVDDRLTTVGHLMGTMPYMAPEQLIDSRDVDARADVYAMGATLYRLIAGRPPHHRHGGPAKHVMAITSQDAPPLDSVREDVDKEVVALVGELISRDPEARPQSAQEVAERLEPFGRGAQLRRLLRQASRRRSADSSVSSTTNPLSQVAPIGGSRSVSGRGLLLLALTALLVLVAGFVFKVATDRGDLVINSPLDGVVLTVSQGDQLVERLEVEIGPDNRITLRKGTYTIAIEGADGLTLSENTVTIGRGTETAVDLTARSAGRVYRGKSLEEWMTLLTREEDPNSLGEIMIAVEVLTRDTELRTQAATETLRTARLWGGFSSSPPRTNESGRRSSEPSQNYMYFLNDVFPKYEAAGLVAIDSELEQGNEKSRLASIWMLNNSLQHSYQIPPQLVDHLKQAIAAIAESSQSHASMAAERGKMTAIALLLRQGRPVAGDPTLEEVVRAELSSAEEQWKNRSSGRGMFGPSHTWVLDEDLLAAAVEIEAAGRLELNWELIAEILVHDRYPRSSERSAHVLEAAADHDSSVVVAAIDAKLQQLSDLRQGFGGGDGGGRGGLGKSMSRGPRDSFWSGQMWIPAFYLLTQDSIWPRALPLYAERTSDAARSLELLEQLRHGMIDAGADRDHADQPFRSLDTAIVQLKQAAASPAAP
jgi:serine/threonine protein kinase